MQKLASREAAAQLPRMVGLRTGLAKTFEAQTEHSIHRTILLQTQGLIHFYLETSWALDQVAREPLYVVLLLFLLWFRTHLSMQTLQDEPHL